MKKVALNVDISEDVSRRFRSTVALVLGGRRGDLSIAVEEALKMYINEKKKNLEKEK